MKKILAFTVLLSTIIFLSGCKEEEATAPSYYKYTGDKAVEAKFLEGSPTSSEIDTYQQKENIEVVVELINRLTEEVEAGKVKVRLTGDAAIVTFFEGAREASNPKMFAIDPNTGVATPEEADLGPIKYVADLETKVQKKITGQYCYSIPVKVKANLFYTDKETEIGNNLPKGSNPPSSVQVTKIEQGTVNRANGGELRFKVTVANIGTGTVIPGLSDCFQYREKTEREELKLAATGAYPIDCGDGIVKLSREDKTRTMECKVTGIDMTLLGPDASELSLTLTDFAYEDELSPVTIWLEP